jgi:hypothetical protein
MKKIIVLLSILSFYLSVNSQITINEVFAANASTNLDTRYYNYSGWVELYNSGSLGINLGNYYFSDDINNKTKWKLPSNTINSSEFAIFWFNEMNTLNYTNFKLDAKGKKLFLFASNGAITDSVSYPKQYPNISYARYPDGSGIWNYNSVPTMQANNSNNASSNFTSVPEFSNTGGFYNTPFSLTLSTLNPGAEIHYTINGSEPKINSLLYTAPISIDTTTIIRAIAFETGHLPSGIVTQTYIFANRQFDLPVYSLSTDSINLWDNTMGMYVDGTNGNWGYCSDAPKNYNQDWERPVNLELFDINGVQRLNQYTGFKIAGNCSRSLPQKSFSIFPRNLYGKGKLKYKFFDDKNISEFDRIFLRNTGNDWYYAFMRDGLFNTLVEKQMDIDYNAYKPSVVYLNGNYWGMLNTREKIDEKYVVANYGLAEDQFDMLENEQSVINGKADNFASLINFVSTNNLSLNANYEIVKSMMDITEYINYMIIEIYVGNTDWPGNNLRYWRSKLEEGKWRWILQDLDFGFSLYDRNISHNTLDFALEPNGPGWPNPPWSTLLFRKLVTNADFKNEFARRFSDYLNTVFEPNRVIHIIDSLQNNISYEMYYHNQKWNGTGNWSSNLDFMRSYASQRPDFVRQHIIDRFGLSGTFQLTVGSNIPGASDLYINQMPVNADLFKGTYFKNYAVHVKPVTRESYKFLGWFKQTLNSATNNLITKGANWKYNDGGALPAADWNMPGYSDASWNSGNAQLGYGDGDETTTVGYGSDANNKYVTTYFRKNFSVDNHTLYNGLKISLLIDDGAVIYLNGTEILRKNMPDGTINYSTLSNVSVGGTDETTYIDYDIPSGSLVDGNNTIAVEVHQANATSSDISFDMQLNATKNQILTEESVKGEEIDITSSSNINLQAKYQHLGNIPEIYFNEFVADNTNGITDETGSASPWIELFNSTGKTANIAGMYVSNNKNNLTLWQLPSGDASKTTINPSGFLILWADGQTGDGFLHLPFQLSEAGGQLYLTNITGIDTTIVDSLTYPPQISNVAFGRYKDGKLDTYYLAMPTPLSPNRTPNRLPEFTSTPVLTAVKNTLYSYNISAFDYEGDKLGFAYTELPSWLSLTDNNNGTATLQGTPLVQNVGTNHIKLSVSDGKSFNPPQQEFNINVQNALAVEILTSDKWSVFPNPVKDFLNIVPGEGLKSYKIGITDIAGKIILEKSKISGNFKLDLTRFSNGVYFLKISEGNNLSVTKFVKEK